MSLLDRITGGESKVIIKVTKDGPSLITWCDAMELKKLPGPQKKQLESFFKYLAEEGAS